MYFYNSKKNHLEFRTAIFEYLQKNKNEYLAYFEGYTDNKGKLLDKNLLFDKYIIFNY